MNIIKRFYYSYKINSLANSLKKEASKKNKSDKKIQEIIKNLDQFVNSKKMEYFSTDRIIKFYTVKVAVLSKNSHLNKNAKFEAVAKKVHALITDRTPEQLKFSSSSNAGVHSTGSGDRPLSPPPPPQKNSPANGTVPPPPPPLPGEAGKPLPRIPKKSADEPQFTGIMEWIPSNVTALNSPNRKKAFLENLKQQWNEWTPEQKQEMIRSFNETILRHLSNQDQAEMRKILEGELSVETLIKMGEYQLQVVLKNAEAARQKINEVEGVNNELTTLNSQLEHQTALLETFEEASKNIGSKISHKYPSGKDGFVEITFYSDKELGKNKENPNLSITKSIKWIRETIEEIEQEITDKKQALEKAQKEVKTTLAKLGKGLKKENIAKLSEDLTKIKEDLSKVSSANENSSPTSPSKKKKGQQNKTSNTSLPMGIETTLRVDPKGLLKKIIL